MKPQLSLYLDAVRFMAALAVFMSHYALHRLTGGFLWQLNSYGHEAVTVFFALSGFVIAHATATRELDARAYWVSRSARIYSVALLAVLLTALLDQWGSHLRPAVYSAGWGYVDDLSFRRFFTALTFTNELWTQSVAQGSNAAYWSMGYEVPYYVIFGLALYAPPRWRVLAVVLALAAAGPSIVASMPVWLSGVAAYRWCQRNTLSERTGLVLFGGSLLAWVAYEWISLRWGRPLLDSGLWFKRQEMLQDYVVGTFFILNMVGFNAAARLLGRQLQRHAAQVRWLAGATFTLYLCHLPIAQFLVACAPWAVSDPRSRALVLVGTLLLVFALAELSERRKQAWRTAFGALASKLHKP